MLYERLRFIISAAEYALLFVLLLDASFQPLGYRPLGQGPPPPEGGTKGKL